jgi:predicted amidohydrolase
MVPSGPKIGIIQLHVPDGCTPAEQYERAASFVRNAAADDADIVILPEMALGFCQGSAQDKDMFAAETYKYIQKFQLLAKVGTPQDL